MLATGGVVFVLIFVLGDIVECCVWTELMMWEARESCRVENFIGIAVMNKLSSVENRHFFWSIPK